MIRGGAITFLRIAAAVMFGALAAVAGEAVELPPLLRPGANPDVMRLASLPFDPGAATDVGDGGWRMTASVNYCNVWNHTWNLLTFHREAGRVGLPVSSEELAALAALNPNQAYQFLDVEAWWTEIWVQYGLGGGVTATLRVPFLDVGRPHWDAIAESWHAWLNLPNFNRHEFPRGETLVYIKGPGGTVERRDLARAGFGDASLSLTIPAGEWLGARHRAVLAAEAPIGKRGTLHGSGGWDAGVRLFSQWDGARISFFSGLGYTWPSSRGTLLGLERSNVWHTMIGFDWRVWRSLLAMLRVQWERSLLAQAAGDRLAKPTLFKRFGVALPLSPSVWLAFDLGQDSIRNGLAPDYSFHLTVGGGL